MTSAAGIIRFSHVGVELTKQLLWASYEAGSLQAHMNHEGHAQLYVRMTTGNFEEKIAAWKEGRAPSTQTTEPDPAGHPARRRRSGTRGRGRAELVEAGAVAPHDVVPHVGIQADGLLGQDTAASQATSRRCADGRSPT